MCLNLVRSSAFLWLLTAQALSERPFGAEDADYYADVVVVGAGIAGLSAAKHIVENSGKSVIILEARTRRGGRIGSDPSMGVWLDMGASWLEGTNGNPVVEYAKAKDLTLIETDWDNYKCYDVDRGGEEVDGDSFDWLFEDVKCKMYKHKGQDALTTIENAVGEPLSRGLNMSLQVDWIDEFGAEPQEMDSWAWEEGGLYNEEQVMVKPGMGWVVEAVWSDIVEASNNVTVLPTSEASKGAQRQSEPPITTQTALIYRARVVRVSEAPGGDLIWLEVEDPKDDKHSFKVAAKKAIVTVPLGVLHAYHSNLIDLDSMPQSQWDAINSMGYGLFNKVYLKFDEVRWPEDVDVFYVLGDGRDNHFGEWVNMYATHGYKVMISMVGGNHALKLAQKSRTEVVDMALAELNTLFAVDAASCVSGRITRWETEEFSGNGSYSYFKLGCAKDVRRTACAPVAVGDSATVFFAGEHCDPDSPATVDGAWVDGIYAGRCLLEGECPEDGAATVHALTATLLLTLCLAML